MIFQLPYFYYIIVVIDLVFDIQCSGMVLCSVQHFSFLERDASAILAGFLL